MATNWTDAQLSAINTRDKTLLVSAAAGSGKTATLTERIIASLTDNEAPADISRMLIVTFTKASAADLKTKISDALANKLIEDPTNDHLAKQLVSLGSANISTIDSFYYDIVRSNYQKLSLPQAPKIADEAEIIPLNIAVMNDVIESFFSHDGFDEFIDHFTAIRDNSMAAEIFISIYDKLLSQQKGFNALCDYALDLEDAINKNIFETKYGEVAILRTTAFVKYAYQFTKDAYDRICEIPAVFAKYGDAFKDDLDFFGALQECLFQKDYVKFTELLNAHKALKPQSLQKYPQFNKLRSIRKKNYTVLEEIKSNYFCFSDEEIKISFKENAKICRQLHELLKEFDARIMNEKSSRGICTFSDIRRFSLELLCDKNGNPTETALEYSDRFDYIYIDEYQDVDEVQDTIFSMIAKPTNRFMVGDIKQSIYAFRNADPSIFAKYKNELPQLGSTTSDAYSLFMSNNFRCDKTVIDFSNAVSSFLFSNRAKSIGYTSDDDLVFSKNNNLSDYTPTPVTVAITGIKPNTEKPYKFSEEQKEYAKIASEKYIADEIIRLVNNENLSNKKISYGDIAILVRNKSSFAPLIKELESRGIPVQAPKKGDFFENPDVLLIMALLSCIDNPQKDVSLAGTLRSPFFRFTLDDILIIRKNSDPSCSLFEALKEYSQNENELGKKCRKFKEKLNYWRNIAASTPCDKLIKRLYNEMSILSLGDKESKNLLTLYEYAIKFESNGFKGLYSFIKYVEELIESGVKLPSSDEITDENCVKIMTIHGSKGLEFPICFIFGCETPFSKASLKKSIQFDRHLGIGFTPHDKTGFAKYDSPLLRSIIYSKLTSEKEEEMRLLYVAMTRAKERLYLVAKLSDPNDKLEKIKTICEYDKEYAVLSANSYIDWTFAALEYANQKDFYRIEKYEVPDTEQLCGKHCVTFQNTDSLQPGSEGISELVTKLKKRFDYQYPFEHISELPAKLSVSSLTPDILDKNDEHIVSVSEFEGDFNAVFENDFTCPEHLEQITTSYGAEKGTATHTFLQFCDFENVVKNGIDEEIARLCNNRFITKRYADIIDKKQLEAFFESRLYERISAAKKVWREQRFNIFLPACEFTQNTKKKELLKNATIAVQGVIDIFFEDSDGKIVLCDYKTDYLTNAELSDHKLALDKLSKRHSRQIFYYAKAIEKILGKAPDEIIIYSLPLKDYVKLEIRQ